MSTRPLGPDDLADARRLGWEAFGVPEDTAGPPPPWAPGMHAWGLFEDGVLTARMIDREYDSWFGGAAVPTSGIAGVTVAAEARGGGRLTPLFADLLAGARKRGAVISTLFPTAPAIYRTFGYEIVGHFDSVDLPTSTLAAVRAPTTSLRTRRASAADVDAVRRVYDAWAAAQNGPLTRRGVSFGTAGEDLLADHTGVTVAVDEAEVVRGYAAWRRGRGYGESSRLAVTDLTATDPDATRALLRTLGTFAPVTPTTRLDTSGEDPVRFVLPTAHWQVVDSEPYMLRVLDVPGAFEARHYPAHLTADLTFRVHDGTVPEVDGTWRLRVADGRASCTPGSGPGIELGSRGLALLYAGAQGTANLRMAGLLEGQDGDDDVWDSLLGGRQVHIRDYF